MMIKVNDGSFGGGSNNDGSFGGESHNDDAFVAVMMLMVMVSPTGLKRKFSTP